MIPAQAPGSQRPRRTSLCRIARRICHALSPIANITTGVLLANDKFDKVSIPLLTAVCVSVLIGYLDNELR
jgi:hypothetical protein